MATAYIETTIPSYYVARPSNSLTQAARQAITRKWWDEGRSEFDLFTSQEVLDEAGRGEHVMADARMALLEAGFSDTTGSKGYHHHHQIVGKSLTPVQL